MKVYTVEKTNKTPFVKLDPKRGRLYMKGRLIPEDPLEFFEGLYKSLDKYLAAPKEETTVLLYFDYINSSSLKMIDQMLGRIHARSKINMIWFVDELDDDMVETAEMTRDTIGIQNCLIKTIEPEIKFVNRFAQDKDVEDTGESIVIPQTLDTPFIKFDAKKGVLYMKGKIVHEDPREMFKPLENKLEFYLKTPMPATNVIIDVDYINTIGSKLLMELLRKMTGETATDIRCTWIVDEDDEDMAEFAEEMSEFAKLGDFEIKKVKRYE